MISSFNGSVYMSLNYQIDYIVSWDEQMKEDLEKFCAKVQKLGDARKDQIELPPAMSWWEINVSWLPGVRKDRVERYRKALVLDVELQKSLFELRIRITEKLDLFEQEFQAAVKSAGWESEPVEEKAAIQSVWDAFREFTDKFKDYNWFLRLGSDRKKRSFRERYPDAHYIYINALSNS